MSQQPFPAARLAGSEWDLVGTEAPRVVFAAAIGLLLGAWLASYANHLGIRSDLDQLLVAARYLRSGVDPYQHVGPGLSSPWPWPLYYPLPAVLLVLPLSWLNNSMAHVVFMSLSCGLLAGALARTGAYRFVLFLSGAFFNAVVLTQWTPILTAAVLLPSLGFVYAAKPNVGAALWGARPSRIALVGAFALFALAFAFDPLWLVQWWDAVRSSPHLRPAILYPWGWLIALAAFRWRRPEARLLVFLAVVPQTLAEYAVLPLFLVPRSVSQAVILVLCSDAVTYYLHFVRRAATDAEYISNAGRAVVLACFLPCLVMVLRRRNEGVVPVGVDRTIARASTLVKTLVARAATRSV